MYVRGDRVLVANKLTDKKSENTWLATVVRYKHPAITVQLDAHERGEHLRLNHLRVLGKVGKATRHYPRTIPRRTAMVMINKRNERVRKMADHLVLWKIGTTKRYAVLRTSAKGAKRLRNGILTRTVVAAAKIMRMASGAIAGIQKIPVYDASRQSYSATLIGLDAVLDLKIQAKRTFKMDAF